MILGIYGAGAMGYIFMGIAQEINQITPRWDQIVFIDDVVDKTTFYDLPIWRWNDLLAHKDEVEIVIANGEPRHRETLYRKAKDHGIAFTTLIAPNVYLADGCTVGEGCVISQSSSLGENVHLGVNTLLDAQVVLAHGTKVGDHCFIGWNVFTGGSAEIENNVFVAAGSRIRDRITIHDWAVIGLGSVVFHSVGKERIILGNPAKKIGDNTSHLIWNN